MGVGRGEPPEGGGSRFHAQDGGGGCGREASFQREPEGTRRDSPDDRAGLERKEMTLCILQLPSQEGIWRCVTGWPSTKKEGEWYEDKEVKHERE